MDGPRSTSITFNDSRISSSSRVPQQQLRISRSARSGEVISIADTGTESELGNSIEDNVLNLAFRDLSTRSAVFRNRLIEEFALLENLSLTGGNVPPPQYNSRDVRDTTTLQHILTESSHQLIKFQAFKRTALDHIDVDRRLTRIRNKDKVPIGAWAGWVVESKTFQNIILLFIVANAIAVGVSAELMEAQENYVGLFQFLEVFDRVSLIIFILEIILQWTDSFFKYWQDAWNIFDFFVTLSTAIPEILPFLGQTSSAGSWSIIAREFRAFRILRALKLAVRFNSIRIIVITIIEALRSMLLIMVLVFLCMFIFGVMGVYMFEPLTKSNLDLVYGKAFENLGSSLEVLFQLITLDNWNDLVADMLTVINPVLTYVYVIVWLWIGSFIIKNIFVGVMVSNFNRISASLREKYQERVKQRKLDQMRRRLKKELNIAKTNIRTSMSKLDSTNVPRSQRPSVTGEETSVKSKRMRRRPSLFSNKPVSLSNSRSPNLRIGEEQGKYEEKVISDSSSPKQGLFDYPPQSPEKEQQPNESLSEMITPELKEDEVIESIQKLLSQAHGVSKGWESTIRETLSALAAKSEQTLWPRDTLFKYFQLMESLQENMREYQELQSMANAVLLELHDM